jgi:hypothetical protein
MAEQNGVLTTVVLDRKAFNVIGPDVVAELTQYHKRVASQLVLSPNPDLGDVYKIKDNPNTLGLTKNALLKIADLAGVVWNWKACESIPPSLCKFCKAAGPTCLKCPHFGAIAYKAVGAYQDAVGQWRILVGTAEVDPSTRSQSMGDQMKQHLLRHVEARAFNAATRTLGVKSSYSPEEMKKPFLVVHTYYDAYSDPELKKLLLAQFAYERALHMGQPVEKTPELEDGSRVVKMLQGPKFTEVMRDMEASVAESVDVQTGEIVPAPASPQDIPYQPEGMPIVTTAPAQPPAAPKANGGAPDKGKLMTDLYNLAREYYPGASGIALNNHLKKDYQKTIGELHLDELATEVALFRQRIAEKAAQPVEVAQ